MQEGRARPGDRPYPRPRPRSSECAEPVAVWASPSSLGPPLQHTLPLARRQRL